MLIKLSTILYRSNGVDFDLAGNLSSSAADSGHVNRTGFVGTSDIILLSSVDRKLVD